MSAKVAAQLVGVRRWEFADEKTGEIKTGATLYVGNENDGADGEKPDPDYLGMKIMKMSAPLSVFKKMALEKPVFPLECELIVTLSLGAEGKAVMKVHDVVFS